MVGFVRDTSGDGAPSVLITGCDRGLGYELAARFAREAWRVFAGCLTPEGRERCAALPARVAVHALALDVSSSTSVAEALAYVTDRARSVELLVNNAAVLGVFDDRLDGPLDFDDMERTYRVNAIGPLRVVHAMLPLLLRAPAPRVVNISSEAGSTGANWRDFLFGYCMSKAALNRQSALVHRFLRNRGGGVLVLHPGWIRTWMKGTLDSEAELDPGEAANLVWENIHRPAAFDGDAPSYRDPAGQEMPW
jgi:NAD(P)-dependent dehydrogenase (short-subunit alcohol dehydrogenase family)